ncbi:MAG: leucine-rich repeat domain-containing protein [Ruminococcaceae bacterium]|nr:leucine-rich repeat domain-containing protein [Oscillospiraceae bacterium]
MKKALSILLSVLILFSVFSSFTAFAVETSGKCGENATYELKDGVLTISGKGEMEDFSEDLSAGKRRSIWKNNTKITKVVVKSGITSVGGEAFVNCTNIASISLPKTIKKIKYYAFQGCSGLTKVTLPEKLEIIGKKAFEGTGLETIVIPKSVQQIGDTAFYRCKSLSKITLPDTVKDIGNAAFSQTAYFKDENNWEDDALYIGKTLIKVKKASHEVYKIKDRTLTVARKAFEASDKVLKKIEFPTSLKNLPLSVFGTFINPNVNEGKSYDVFIPKSITYIINDYIVDTGGINSVKVSSKNTHYDSRKSCNAIIETKTNTLIFGCEKSTIPNTVEKIAEYAFYSVNKEYLFIPKSVKKIEDKAFKDTFIGTIYYSGSTSDWKRVKVVYDKIGDKEIYDYKYSKSIENETIYTAVKYYHSTPIKVKKLTSGKKSFKVTFNKLGGAKGYQIQYSTDKKFKKYVHKVTLKGNKTFSRTVKGLSAKKKYYVRVRGYSVKNGKNIYANWSKSKSIKTK